MSDENSNAVALPTVSLFPSELREFVLPGAASLLVCAAIEAEFDALAPDGSDGNRRLLHHVARLTQSHLAYTLELGANDSTSLGLVVAQGLAALLGMYIAGQVVASLASLLLDRVLVAKAYDYPYAYLRRAGQAGGRPKYYAGYVFWGNTFIGAFLVRFLISTAGPAANDPLVFVMVMSLGVVGAVVGVKLCGPLLRKSAQRPPPSTRAAALPSTTSDAPRGAPTASADVAPTVPKNPIVAAALVLSFAAGALVGMEMAWSFLWALQLAPASATSLFGPAIALGALLLAFVARLASRSRGRWTAWDALAVRRELLDVWFPMPYQLIASLMGHALGTKDHFPPDLIREWTRKLRLMHVDLQTGATEIFWAANLWLIRQGGPLAKKVSEWQVAYGTARNLATGFWLASIYGAALMAVHLTAHAAPTDRANIESAVSRAALLALVSLAISCVMLYRYYYLFFKYFSKVLFRSFIWFAPEGVRDTSTSEEPLAATERPGPVT
jgi:hypothetical protein